MGKTKPASSPDLGSVGAGTKVFHRAFGEGTVLRMETNPAGNAYVYVSFGGTERKFGFPGAFYDGYLMVLH